MLLGQRILWLDQNPDQGFLVKFFQRSHHRQSANELGDQAVLQGILGFYVYEWFAGDFLGVLADDERPARS